MAFSARRVSRLLKLVTAAYVLALAMLPFGHHDLVCHLKSSTHCTTCLIGTSADESSAPALPPVVLADEGLAEDGSHPVVVSRIPTASSGRSPPTLHRSHTEIARFACCKAAHNDQF